MENGKSIKIPDESFYARESDSRVVYFNRNDPFGFITEEVSEGWSDGSAAGLRREGIVLPNGDRLFDLKEIVAYLNNMVRENGLVKDDYKDVVEFLDEDEDDFDNL